MPLYSQPGCIKYYIKLRRLRLGKCTRKRGGEKPPDSEIRAWEVQHENMMLRRKFTQQECIQWDETGTNPKVGPPSVLGPKDSERPEHGVAEDDKYRFTTMIGVDGAGTILPFAFILKCSVNKDNMTSSTVIKTMHQTRGSGFERKDGYEHIVHEREVPNFYNTKKKKHEHRIFIQDYLQHKEEGTVILANDKAWMKTQTYMLLLDAIIGWWKIKHDLERIMLLADGCSTHKMECLIEVYNYWSIEARIFNPHMTPEKAVCDLVINRVFKGQVIALRINTQLLPMFVKFKADYARAYKNQCVLPVWAPPKPDVGEVIKGLVKLRLPGGIFASVSFKEGLVRSWRSTRAIQLENGEWAPLYSSNRKSGSVPIKSDLEAPLTTEELLAINDDDSDSDYDGNSEDESEDEYCDEEDSEDGEAGEGGGEEMDEDGDEIDDEERAEEEGGDAADEYWRQKSLELDWRDD
jgi:hypothetical protein